METPVLNINVNFSALWSNYFIQLQHLLDVITFLQLGTKNIKEDDLSEPKIFSRMTIAQSAKLSFDEAKNKSEDWLLRSFLRDSIEITGIYLDECLSTCAVLTIAKNKNSTVDEIEHLFNVLPKVNHRLFFQTKLEKLKNEFGIKPEFTEHILSINKARACVVHRLGFVSPLDFNGENKLVIKFRKTEAVLVGKDGKETILEKPTFVEKESTLNLRFIDDEKTFAIGEQVKLSNQEIYSCLFTFFAFATSLSESIIQYAKDLGHPIQDYQANHEKTD